MENIQNYPENLKGYDYTGKMPAELKYNPANYFSGLRVGDPLSRRGSAWSLPWKIRRWRAGIVALPVSRSVNSSRGKRRVAVAAGTTSMFWRRAVAGWPSSSEMQARVSPQVGQL